MYPVALVQQETNPNMQPPKAVYQKYSRKVVYDMNEYQFRLLMEVAKFPQMKDLHHAHKVLIMFLEYNPKYQGNSYMHIWFGFAHERFLTKNPVTIEEYPFEPARHKTIPFQFSFPDSS